jgi:hypothetical protein
VLKATHTPKKKKKKKNQEDQEDQEAEEGTKPPRRLDLEGLGGGWHVGATATASGRSGGRTTGVHKREKNGGPWKASSRDQSADAL